MAAHYRIPLSLLLGIAFAVLLIAAGCGSNAHSGDLNTQKSCNPNPSIAVLMYPYVPVMPPEDVSEPEVTKVCPDISPKQAEAEK